MPPKVSESALQDAAQDVISRALPLIHAYSEVFQTIEVAEKYVGLVLKLKSFQYNTTTVSGPFFERLKRIVLREVTSRALFDGRLLIQDNRRGTGPPSQTVHLRTADNTNHPEKGHIAFTSPENVVVEVSEAVMSKIVEVQRNLPNGLPSFATYRNAKQHVRTMCKKRKIDLEPKPDGQPKRTAYFICTVVVHLAVEAGMVDIKNAPSLRRSDKFVPKTIIEQTVAEVQRRANQSPNFTRQYDTGATLNGKSQGNSNRTTSPTKDTAVAQNKTVVPHKTGSLVSVPVPVQMESSMHKVELTRRAASVGSAASSTISLSGSTAGSDASTEPRKTAESNLGHDWNTSRIIDMHEDVLAMRFAFAEQLMVKLNLRSSDG
ncbi:hypothetical protein NX059_009809 [Plenodomus lindquistii]|nr:hypothetical protein NX059_009809 [Plenodomus lindquistii]